MGFLGMDIAFFFASEDIFSANHSFKSLTNFPGELLLFIELLDLLMDFFGMDLDLFLEAEDIFFEELPLFMELLIATFLFGFLRICIAFFLVPAEVDILLPLIVDLTFLDFLFLLEVDSFLMSNS